MTSTLVNIYIIISSVKFSIIHWQWHSDVISHSHIHSTVTSYHIHSTVAIRLTMNCYNNVLLIWILLLTWNLMQVAKDIPEKFIQWTLNSFCWFKPSFCRFKPVETLCVAETGFCRQKPNHARTRTILNMSTWSVINKLWLSFQLQSNSSSLLLKSIVKSWV